MTERLEMNRPHSSTNEENVTFETFLGFCREMAQTAGVTINITEKQILFSGTAKKNVDLKYSIQDGFVSVRSREYCPGYEGTPDTQWFIVETISDHIQIAQGAHREGPDWRQILDQIANGQN